MLFPAYGPRGLRGLMEELREPCSKSSYQGSLKSDSMIPCGQCAQLLFPVLFAHGCYSLDLKWLSKLMGRRLGPQLMAPLGSGTCFSSQFCITSSSGVDRHLAPAVRKENKVCSIIPPPLCLDQLCQELSVSECVYVHTHARALA